MPSTNKGTVIAEGAYTYHYGESSTGHETWQLTKLAHGGLVFTSRIEMTSPQASTLSLTFEATQNWTPIHFSARLETEGKSLTSEQHAAGTQWLARIEPRGGHAQDLALDNSGKPELKFASPLFLTPTLFRLNLQVGQSRELDAIVIDEGTFAPRAAKLKYTCIAEEQVEVPAGKFAAWHYTENESNFWADRNGVVLLYETATGDTSKLARYRRIERR